MLSLKDKVADKLSRLLGDSPPPPPSSSSPSQHSPPTARSEPDRGGSVSMEGLSPSRTSVISSFFLSFLPKIYSSTDGPTKPTRTLPCRSLPRRWKINSFSLKDKPLDCSTDSRTDTESDSADENYKEKLGDAPQGNCNGFQKVEKDSKAHDSGDFLSCLSEKSAFISEDLFEFLQSSLPSIVKGCKWVLLYSTLKHGISLQTLLRKSADLSGPCLLIAGDMQGAIFGGLLDGPLKTTPKRKYQGSNKTFVFTTIYGEPRLFRATGANRYYYMCVNDLLAFGGGGSFALCLEEDLLHGSSGPSETFGNLCLAHNPEFELKNVEVWCFTYSSRYLT
ncbi:uncharacterized protein A4U43_C04F1990 [Asparagus officinalis]|uniref:TLDc domain-containing protein n=1 Tax=Asparagus officinalis TaxID=4686 RepID=A0A5P1EY25_ASPOF|nr:oxidation resistance protein 1 [Asparagus officinalis]ONK70832.1 uncharacterized protein A4U43_C04F1990 [Asparagus officinalis]